jgi:hypothetical protein
MLMVSYDRIHISIQVIHVIQVDCSLYSDIIVFYCPGSPFAIFSQAWCFRSICDSLLFLLLPLECNIL